MTVNLIELITNEVSQAADTVSTVGGGRNIHCLFTAELEQRFREEADHSIHHQLTWQVEGVGVLIVDIEGEIVFEHDDRAGWLKKASIEAQFDDITIHLNEEPLRLTQQVPSTDPYVFELGAVTGRLIELPMFVRNNCPAVQFANHH